MKSRDVLTVLGTACITMAAALAWFAPTGATASGDSSRVRPQIAVPTLEADGCRVYLETDRGDYAAGDKPVLRLRAVNDTETAASLRVQLGITATSPSSPLSRMVALPTPLWNGEWAVEIPPGETRTSDVPTETDLPADQEISVTMGTGDLSILAGLTSIRRAAPNTAQAAAADEMAPTAALTLAPSTGDRVQDAVRQLVLTRSEE